MAKAKRSVPKGRKQKPGGVTFAEVVKLGRELPDVEVSTSYGTPALKVRKKLLVRLKEDGQTLVLMTTFDERERLLAAAPEVFYFTEHYRNYPMVLVRLAKIDRDFLRELLEHAWRLVAGELQA